jgi:hypothetical protein
MNSSWYGAGDQPPASAAERARGGEENVQDKDNEDPERPRPGRETPRKRDVSPVVGVGPAREQAFDGDIPAHVHVIGTAEPHPER